MGVRLFFAALLLIVPAIVNAGFIDKLIMPGKLSTAHVEFEADCDSCHQKLKKESQVKLCTGCHDHKDIAKDIKQKTGLHGRDKRIRAEDCRVCHTEHVGRSGSIIDFDKGSFGHKATDFPLKGRHQKVACGRCHKAKEKFSQAKKTCFACHKQDDAHKEKLGKKCQDCHSAESWKKTKYDHDKKTDFPLKGKHKKVDCDLCHVDAKYEKTPSTCVACHKANDIHNNEYGKKCERCHEPAKWKKTRFEHDKKEYKLKDAHDVAPCGACHKNEGFDDELGNKCVTCHKVDDVHKARFGKKCDSCHGQKSWATSLFDHDKDTKFRLNGRHKKVECDACHRGVIKKEKLGKRCVSCHKPDDVHKGQEGKQCQLCHNEEAWTKRLVFDHGQSRFPLMGQHSILSCEACHENNRFKDVSIRCVSCHEADDVHENSMGDKCLICHTPNDWRIWAFDHDKNTDFVINGEHEELNCGACHVANKRKVMKISKNCRSCHRADDVHRGSFGRACQKCHTTKSFSDIKNVR